MTLSENTPISSEIIVGQHELAIGDSGSVFVSEGFRECCPFLLRSADGHNYGLFHMRPHTQTSSSQEQKLEDVFKNGQLLILQGAIGEVNNFSLFLMQRMGIKLPDSGKFAQPFKLNTGREHSRVNFSPSKNQAVIVSNQYSDTPSEIVIPDLFETLEISHEHWKNQKISRQRD